MGAGGFRKNPGWEILSSDDLMDADFDNDYIIDNFHMEDEYDEVEDTLLNDPNAQIVMFMPRADEEVASEEEYDDFDDIEDADDYDNDDDYMPSDSLDEEDFDDDNAIVSNGEDSAPELSN